MQQQNEEEIFHYDVVCGACFRHLYALPKHDLIYFGQFVRLCSDGCLKSLKGVCPTRTERLSFTIVNEILKNPELYDFDGLPVELQTTLRWALNNKEDIHSKRKKGRCDCSLAYDCYGRSKKLV